MFYLYEHTPYRNNFIEENADYALLKQTAIRLQADFPKDGPNYRRFIIKNAQDIAIFNSANYQEKKAHV